MSSLLNQSALNKLPVNLHNKYRIASESYYVKYAVRTLNQMILQETKEDLKSYWIKDIESGSWTIDICELDEADTFFKENSVEEILDAAITFINDWEENELESD